MLNRYKESPEVVPQGYQGNRFHFHASHGDGIYVNSDGRLVLRNVNYGGGGGKGEKEQGGGDSKGDFFHWPVPHIHPLNIPKFRRKGSVLGGGQEKKQPNPFIPFPKYDKTV